MTIAKIDLQHEFPTTAAGWVGLYPTQTTDIPVTDINGDPTGWTIRYEAGFLPSEAGGNGFNGVGAGDAAWVDSASVMAQSTYGFGDPGAKIILTGPDELLSLRCASSYENSGIATDVLWTVNGTSQVINSYDSVNARAANDTAAIFTNVAKNGAGVFEITFTGQSSTRGYATALYIETAPGPSLTVTQTTLTPSGTISGSYSNYTTVPTTLTVSDGTNTITIASPTISDNGDGTGTFSGTMPALPTSGTANLILFGNVTVELS